MTNGEDRLDRVERILEAIATNQLQERDRRLELREDLEILEQRLMQTQNQIDAIAAQLQVLTADVTATQSQWVTNYAAEAQARAEYQRQMLGLLLTTDGSASPGRIGIAPIVRNSTAI